jgi:hypothetical protein
LLGSGDPVLALQGHVSSDNVAGDRAARVFKTLRIKGDLPQDHAYQVGSFLTDPQDPRELGCTYCPLMRHG